jgi:hypothetical protein
VRWFLAATFAVAACHSAPTDAELTRAWKREQRAAENRHPRATTPGNPAPCPEAGDGKKDRDRCFLSAAERVHQIAEARVAIDNVLGWLRDDCDDTALELARERGSAILPVIADVCMVEERRLDGLRARVQELDDAKLTEMQLEMKAASRGMYAERLREHVGKRGAKP